MADLVLVVDDEPVQRRLIEASLEKLGYRVMCADGGQAAIDALTDKSADAIKAVILDLVMPDIDGLSVLNAMQTHGLQQPVIVQTAQGGVETAVNAMRAGAVDFVVKPAAPARLKTAIQNALKLGALEITKKRKRKPAPGNGGVTVDEIISASPKMETVKQIVTRGAKSGIPVLIEGESGVGKEMIARAIHGMSKRASGPMITVNCGALPETLVESILFGHEKGAFTGASEKHAGKFQEAHGGTLFLDEVGELPLDLQVKLLRAIQEGEIDPVGSAKPQKVDIRLVSATNRNLIDEVDRGRFREDLYYRLNVLPLTVPPLRERREDIPALIDHFVRKICAEEDRPDIKGVDANAIAMLCIYDWPGNIRQLENAIFRAVVLCDGPYLGKNEFPQLVLETQGLPLDPVFEAPSMETPLAGENRQHAPDPASLPAHEGMSLVNAKGDVVSLEEAEHRVIAFAIERYEGKISQIARKLGIGRSTLYRKMRHYGLEVEDSDS